MRDRLRCSRPAGRGAALISVAALAAAAASLAACGSTETVKTVTVEREVMADPASTAGREPAPPRRKRVTYRACDANIEARVDNTTCEFAQNTFWSYWTAGRRSPILVYSPAAEEMFLVRCRVSGAKVRCRAEDGGGVRFTVAALDAYSQAQADNYAANHDVGPIDDEPESGGYVWEDEEDYSEYPDLDEEYGAGGDHGYGYGRYGGTLPGENIPNYENGRGYRVRCKDGTYSRSGGIQGACSHHGGVAP